MLEKARATAVSAFTELAWGETLAFYRPSGLELDHCIEDLVRVVTETADRARGRRLPLDGIVWPKVVDEAEIVFVDDLLSELEARCHLERRAIKLAFLVEAGRAVARVDALVETALPRLAGVIWGVADYSADVGLPVVENAHPACDRARSAIVNAAGAAGVPAIDAMTFEYPVRDPSSTPRPTRSGSSRQCVGASTTRATARTSAWRGSGSATRSSSSPTRSRGVTGPTVRPSSATWRTRARISRRSVAARERP